MVVGEKEVQCLDCYMQTFATTDDLDRFYRKLGVQKGRIVATKSVIGKNTMLKFAKEIAVTLDLKEPEA